MIYCLFLYSNYGLMNLFSFESHMHYIYNIKMTDLTKIKYSHPALILDSHRWVKIPIVNHICFCPSDSGIKYHLKNRFIRPWSKLCLKITIYYNRLKLETQYCLKLYVRICISQNMDKKIIRPLVKPPSRLRYN